MTLLVKIKSKKARKILEEMASEDIIEITEELKPLRGKKSKSESETLTHLASETSLAKEWNKTSKDKAWRDL
ncbi:MAG: hypothetical protein ACTHK8_16040 [Ginsengibacter sp.]